MTLYNAFFTMLIERPADIQDRSAPSFWACFTDEFINTVQREPRSTGATFTYIFLHIGPGNDII